jgi:DedD protein
MAAAIILVPEMLSGPPQQGRVEPARTAGETPVKTYTIDLSQAATSQTPNNEVPDTRAPPSESLPPAPADTPSDETTDNATQADPESSGSTTSDQAASNTAPEAPIPAAQSHSEEAASQPEAQQSAPAEPPSRAPIASAAAAPKSQGGSGWAVQLGSFSSQATAERLTNELRAEGYDAFVMPVKSNAATLYRVRIGPMPSRELADATLRKVKSKVAGAAVVAHR